MRAGNSSRIVTRSSSFSTRLTSVCGDIQRSNPEPATHIRREALEGAGANAMPSARRRYHRRDGQCNNTVRMIRRLLAALLLPIVVLATAAATRPADRLDPQPPAA